MRVTAQVKEQTEKSIRAAARRLFVKKGLAETSTREIAVAAKIAVGTLFNYFPSKESLAISIAADAFSAGRTAALERLGIDGEGHAAASSHERGSPSRIAGSHRSTSARSPEEDLFILVAADIRALEPIRAFIADVLEAGLSPFAAGAATDDATSIRTERLQDAAGVLARHHLAEAATPPVMHLYWALYLGVISYWASDASPKQEDTWALLDQSVRMFVGGLARTHSPMRGSSDAPEDDAAATAASMASSAATLLPPALPRDRSVSHSRSPQGASHGAPETTP